MLFRSLNISFLNIIILFFVGVIASATMVIPGVSGSMILLLLGFYNPILTAIKEFMVSLFSLDIARILNGLGILVPFGIGVVFGIFFLAKMIELIFAKFPLYAYWAIIGLIVASPIAIIIIGEFSGFTALNIITGVICLALGFGISYKLGE